MCTNASRRLSSLTQLPSLLCANVRSVVTKMDEVSATLNARRIDIFVCTESWLNTSKHGNVCIPGYVCLREDRQDRIGGGVAVWLRDSIVFSRRRILHCPTEIECLVVVLHTFKFLLFSAYIPPLYASSCHNMISHFIISCIDDFLSDFPHYDVVVCGDLNRFDVSEICLSLSLNNMYNLPTYGDSQLDYILMTDDLCNSYSVRASVPFDRSVTPHVSLFAVPSHKYSVCHDVHRKVFDLRESYLNSFVATISKVDWQFLYDDYFSLDQKCNHFQEHLNSAVDACIPTSYVRCSPKDKPWITPVIKDLINKRWIAYRKRNFPAYEFLKNKVKEEIAKSKVAWTKKTASADLWKAVSAHVGTKRKHPLTSLLSQFANIHEGVEAMNNHLSSVFLKSDLSKVHIHTLQSVDPGSMDSLVSPQIVENMLLSSNKNKSSSDFPTAIYRAAAKQLAAPLCQLFRISLRNCKIPKLWKSAAITPVPKCVSPSLNDIRPISVLPLPAKLLENLVLGRYKSKLLSCYGKHQFGFRPESSTLCALVSLHDRLTYFLDDPKTYGVCVISYDYSKAFDSIKSEIIIQKLIDYEFPPQFIRWTYDYLSSRSQYVKVGITCSTHIDMTSGVPQGSVLGPFLFSVAVYSLVVGDSVLCHMIKYADDITLCLPLFRDCNNAHVLREHESVLCWSNRHDLHINATKCKILTIKKSEAYNDFVIPNVTAVEVLPILGVRFNNRGTWSSHVDSVVATSSRRFYAARILRRSLSKSSMLLLYFSLIRSVMEYCAPLFISLSVRDCNRLDRIQRRFHRLICGEECNKVCLTNLSKRRVDLSLKFLNRIMSPSHVLHALLPPMSNSGRFLLPRRKTIRRSKTFMLSACSLYNDRFRRH